MNARSFSPCLGQSQIPWVGITYCLGQWRINTYFISPCLIGYQMGTRVGAQKHTPLVRLSSTISPFAGRLVRRMQYAPTLPAEKSDLKGWYGVMFGTMGDESVFHSSISNRLSDRHLCRGVLNTPLNHSRKGYSIARQTIVGRTQYAPTLPAEKSDLKGWCEVMFGTRGDKSVFHSSISNRLSDGCPGRGVLHTPLIDSTSTYSPLAGRLVGRMQYAPTLSEKDKVSSGMCFLLSRTIRDKYVFHFFMSNRLSDRYPCRGVLNTPHIDSTSTRSPFAGHLVGRMQYAPTFPEKDEVSLGGERFSANGSDLFCRVNHKRE